MMDKEYDEKGSQVFLGFGKHGKEIAVSYWNFWIVSLSCCEEIQGFVLPEFITDDFS